MKNVILIYVTAGSRKEADRIAQHLIEERLAACVSIVPEVYSRYRWKGHIEYGKELLLMIKTRSSLYPRIEKRIRELHSYDTPEILAVPVVQGAAAYLSWVKESVR